MIWFSAGVIIGGAAVLLVAHEYGRKKYEEGIEDGQAVGYNRGHYDGMKRGFDKGRGV